MWDLASAAVSPDPSPPPPRSRASIRALVCCRYFSRPLSETVSSGLATDLVVSGDTN
jgi:hypothetical protein